MVRIVSPGSVGVIMNQKSILIMLTIQTAWCQQLLVAPDMRTRSEKTDPVQVKAIAKHELPETDGLLGVGFERASKGKAKGGREEQSGSYPVDAHETVPRASDAALRRVRDGNHWNELDQRVNRAIREKSLTVVEATCDSHESDLKEKEATQDARNFVALVVDGADADEMHDGADGDENGRQERLEEVELLTHRGWPVDVKKGHS
jgi:hypothetical protein